MLAHFDRLGSELDSTFHPPSLFHIALVTGPSGRVKCHTMGVGPGPDMINVDIRYNKLGETKYRN